MSNTCFLMVLISLAACGHKQKEQAGKIEGLYAGQYASEYSIGTDTIEIRAINEVTGTYRFTRRTAYRWLLNPGRGVSEHKVETSTAVFNAGTFQLMEQGHGRIYSLSADRNQLVFGNSIYKRVR